MNHVFAPTIHLAAIDYLAFLIADFLELYTVLYPNESFIPKLHYMSHYPSCIKKVGPLTYLSSIRFEAKHSFFKLSHITCNFKNICKTLTTRHQLNQSFRFYSRENINSDAFLIGSGDFAF